MTPPAKTPTTFDVLSDLRLFRAAGESIVAALDADRPVRDPELEAAFDAALATSRELADEADRRLAEERALQAAGQPTTVPCAPDFTVRGFTYVDGVQTPTTARAPICPERPAYWIHVRNVEGPAGVLAAQAATVPADPELHVAVEQAASEWLVRAASRRDDDWRSVRDALEAWSFAWKSAEKELEAADRRIVEATNALIDLARESAAGRWQDETGEVPKAGDRGIEAVARAELARIGISI